MQNILTASTNLFYFHKSW